MVASRQENEIITCKIVLINTVLLSDIIMRWWFGLDAIWPRTSTISGHCEGGRKYRERATERDREKREAQRGIEREERKRRKRERGEREGIDLRKKERGRGTRHARCTLTIEFEYD